MPGDLVIQVKGIDDLMVYRAKCCNPIRGEAIVGYVTRGKGVAVHSTTCSNVQNLMYEVERRIDVEWARSVEECFPVKIVVHTNDRPGMLSELTSVLFSESSNIRSLEAKQFEKEGAVVDMTVDVQDKKQLERIVWRAPPHLRHPRHRAHLTPDSMNVSNAVPTDPEHIAVSKSKGIHIDWKDGHSSEYEPDITCAITAPARSAPERMAHRPRRRAPDPFQMYKPALKIERIEEVGTYALRLYWNDGHSTGIYSWEVFRRICPCAECRKGG